MVAAVVQDGGSYAAVFGENANGFRN